jgi:hypothetical protein
MHPDCVTRHPRSRESPFSISCKGKAHAKPTNCNPMSFQHGVVEVRCRELTVSKTLDSLLRGAIRRLHRSANGVLWLSRSGHSPASRDLLPVASTKEIGIFAPTPVATIYAAAGSPGLRGSERRFILFGFLALAEFFQPSLFNLGFELPRTGRTLSWRGNYRRHREIVTMKIRDSVAFVTGANRGLGLAFAQELLAAGARKVYAAARNPEQIPLTGAVRVPLDVTAPNAIEAGIYLDFDPGRSLAAARIQA